MIAAAVPGPAESLPAGSPWPGRRKYVHVGSGRGVHAAHGPAKGSRRAAIGGAGLRLRSRVRAASPNRKA